MVNILTWRRVWPWLIAGCAIIGIGVVTFVFSGVLTPKRAPEIAPRLVYVAAPQPGTFLRAAVLQMRWGTGPRDIWPRRPEEGQSLEAVFPGDGGLYVVDHPATHDGARVRRFSRRGDVEATVFTPSGSTLFTPRRAGGFMYDLAKSAGPSEQVVAVDASGSTVATFVVPNGLNAGGLVEIGARLYAKGVQTKMDPIVDSTISRDALIPVADGGRQITGAQAVQQVREGASVGLDGTVYERTRSRFGSGMAQSDEQTVGPAGGRVGPVFAGSAQFVGADASHRLYLLLPPAALSGDGLLPEWPATVEPLQRLLVARLDGRVDAVLVIPDSAELRATRDRVFLGPSGVYVPSADRRGVTIWLYAEKAQ